MNYENGFPEDPFDDIIHFADACTAIGAAVLDKFAKDESVTTVLVEPDGNGGWWVREYSE